MTFYLDQLKDVETDPSQLLLLSPGTICLCLAAIIPAEKRYNWIQDLDALSDVEWGEAVVFLSAAYQELRGSTGQINGGAASSGGSVFSVDGGFATSVFDVDLEGGLA